MTAIPRRQRRAIGSPVASRIRGASGKLAIGQAGKELTRAVETSSLQTLRSLWPLATVLLAMAAYRFVMLANEPGPPGSDAGNWLAFSRELFGGHVKAAASMYFPVTLVLLKALMLFFPPLLALKALAVIASISAGVPFYLLLRRACPPIVAAALTLALLMAGYSIEMLAWGGYPQLLATSFFLTSLLCLDEGLVRGDGRLLVVGGAFAALVAGTHHFTLLILAASVAVYAPWVAWRLRADLRAVATRFAVWGGFAAALSLLFAPWYLRYVSLLAGDGALNANSEQLGSLSRAFSFVYAEAPLTWMLLMVVVPVAALLPFGGASAARLRPLAIALVLGPALVYLPTKEVRVFQPMQAGMLLCLGVVALQVEAALRSDRLRPSIALAGKAASGLALAGLLFLIVSNGASRFVDARDRYTGIDANARAALDWVRANTPDDALFVAGGRGGWVNYAWWVEGYAGRPTYGLINPDFLAFQEERDQTAIAHRLVEAETPPAEVRDLLNRSGIDYVFVYKPSGGPFQNLVDKAPVLLSYQNEDFAVLRIAPAADTAVRP